MPQNELQRYTPGWYVEPGGRPVVGKHSVDVNVSAGIRVVRARRVAVVFPADQPGVDRIAGLEAVPIRLGLTVAVDYLDDLADEQACRGSAQLKRRACPLDQSCQLEGVRGMGELDQRQARITDRRVEDGVEMVGEALGCSTRRLDCRSARCAAG